MGDGECGLPPPVPISNPGKTFLLLDSECYSIRSSFQSEGLATSHIAENYDRQTGMSVLLTTQAPYING